MGIQAVQFAGGSQPHENMMPFLVISFIISLFGIFPRRP
jgi:microcystin-dependent protein